MNKFQKSWQAQSLYWPPGRNSPTTNRTSDEQTLAMLIYSEVWELWILPLPRGSIVAPFWGSYLESYKEIPKRNYCGAYGEALNLTRNPTWEFPKIRGYLIWGSIIRILLFRVLYWGPLRLETPT